MLLLGIDIGTSAIKASVVDSSNGLILASVQYPDTEREIKSIKPGWAEQSPGQWWSDLILAVQKAHSSKAYEPAAIGAIGIAYQMHGLVCVDKQRQVLRDSIIWCDSRAVATGNRAFESIGPENCLSNLLNSPGNFTASKLGWVKEREPQLYSRIDKIMLPGDFIAMKMTGEISTSVPALSEGIFWDFVKEELSDDVMTYFGFERSLIPPIKNVFSEHGKLWREAAEPLGLRIGIPVSYKAGDQPNNALSLQVLDPGEVAATAGTSGVVYAVSDQLRHDLFSRVNSFAHVNHTNGHRRLGVLLNINGTGILNRWVRTVTGNGYTYQQMNELAMEIPPGAEGLSIFPFGNGAERMLNNRIIHAHVQGIDFNRHHHAHFFRAAQEGIAFAFRYGMDILRENAIHPSVIRAGKANMFQSKLFTEAFVNTIRVPVEFYATDGSAGAALGAGIGASVFTSPREAFRNSKPIETVEPRDPDTFEELYQNWKVNLKRQLNA